MNDIDTQLTQGSIGNARAVCETLSYNGGLSMDQRAALMYAEAILDLVQVNQVDSEDRGPQGIPIPEEALSNEAAATVAEWAHGQATDDS